MFVIHKFDCKTTFTVTVVHKPGNYFWQFVTSTIKFRSILKHVKDRNEIFLMKKKKGSVCTLFYHLTFANSNFYLSKFQNVMKEDYSLVFKIEKKRWQSKKAFRGYQYTVWPRAATHRKIIKYANKIFNFILYCVYFFFYQLLITTKLL